MAVEPLSRPQVSWPKVLGILMIIFGSLGILCNTGGAYTNYGFRALTMMQDMVVKAGGKAPYTAEQMEFLKEPLMHNWNMVMTAYLGLEAVLAVVLLVCGIGLISRHAWAARLTVAWAGIKVVLELANAAGNWIVQQKIVHAVQAGTIKEEVIPPGLISTSIGGLAGQVVLGLAIPVFLLIWFSLSTTREETVHWT